MITHNENGRREISSSGKTSRLQVIGAVIRLFSFTRWWRGPRFKLPTGRSGSFKPQPSSPRLVLPELEISLLPFSLCVIMLHRHFLFLHLKGLLSAFPSLILVFSPCHLPCWCTEAW